MRKKILVDATSTLLPQGGYLSGIGQSTLWLLQQLSKHENLPFDVEIYAFPGLNNLNFNFYNLPFRNHIIPLPKRFSQINKRKSLAVYWRKTFYNYNLFHIPGVIDDVYDNEPYVSTIHDLIAYKNLSSDSREKELHKKIAHGAKGLICISNYVKSQVVDLLNINPEKCKVIYWARNEMYRKLPSNVYASVLRKYSINSPYFFSCSCNAPRKNVITALRAYKKFLTYNPNHIFVLLWRNPYREILTEFSKEIDEKKIVFLPHVNDEELVSLYNGASLTVYISREEGFGSPIHESYGCGTPVMTCRNSSLQEVGGDSAIYVGEDAIDDMVDVFVEFERGEYDIERFLEKSKNELKRFSVEKCVNEYIDFYNDCM